MERKRKKKVKKKKARNLIALSAIIDRPSAGAFKDKTRDKKSRRQEDKKAAKKQD